MSILPIRPPRGPFDSVFDEGDYWPDEIKRPNSLANLIVGLGGMFHQPPMQLGINFHPPRPRQDSWFNNWNIGISPGMEELPDYPKTEDQTTGGDIARAWHQMQKDFAHQTMNENFPSYKPHKPQPFNANQSYDDYMNEHKLVLRNLDPFFLNNYQRAKPEGFSLFGKEEAPVQNADAPKAPTPEPSTASIPQPQEPGFFKPLDQMLKEVEERNARGEFFDESGKWVKRDSGTPSIPEAPSAPALPEDSPYITGKVHNDISWPAGTLNNRRFPSPEQETERKEFLNEILGVEGGYNNDSLDRGGETYKGISDNFYELWLKRPDVNPQEWPTKVTDLTSEQRDNIYRNEFYYDRNVDKVNNSDVKRTIFDMNVMHGPAAGQAISAKVIKELLPNVDLGGNNVLGPQHRAAIDEIERRGLLAKYLEKIADERINYPRGDSAESIAREKRFGRGWANRINRLRPTNPNNILYIDPNNRWIKGE
ncbi:MAG: glycosyl hydrolase 108 family protein [Dongiaceae bacterium]